MAHNDLIMRPLHFGLDICPINSSRGSRFVIVELVFFHSNPNNFSFIKVKALSNVRFQHLFFGHVGICTRQSEMGVFVGVTRWQWMRNFANERRIPDLLSMGCGYERERDGNIVKEASRNCRASGFCESVPTFWTGLRFLP